MGGPLWLENITEDYVDEFFRSSQAYHSALGARSRPINQEAEQSIDYERSRCRACKKEGWRKTFPHFNCDKHDTWDDKYHAQLKRVEESLRDEFAAQAAQAALDRKSAEDERAREEAEAARAWEERRARATDLCLRCKACINEGFGLWQKSENMCSKHRKEFEDIL